MPELIYICSYTVFLLVCPGERVFGHFLGVHRRIVLGNEETPLLTGCQLVSCFSPGPTSCRLHRISLNGVDEVDGLVYWFL